MTYDVAFSAIGNIDFELLFRTGLHVLIAVPSIHPSGHFPKTQLLWPRTWVVSPCEEGAKFLLLQVPRVKARPPGTRHRAPLSTWDQWATQHLLFP